MCYSDLDEDVKDQLYYAISRALPWCTNYIRISRWHRDKFIAEQKAERPELVATCLAKVRLGLPF